MPPRQIDPLSVSSLFLEVFYEDTRLASGTGFVVEVNSHKYLITNWHIVSGRHPDTGVPSSPTAAIPNKIIVWHNQNGRLGNWITAEYALVNEDDNPLWMEHPRGREIDVIALDITPEANDERFAFYPLDLSLRETDLVLSPAESISIIGFPFGVAQAGRLAIWKTGHIASDLDIDYNTRPIFLTDVTTKSGMSGSPVIARRIGSYRTSTGTNLGGSATKLLGIYSGRVPDNDGGQDSNIGMVWKARVLDEILPPVEGQ